MGNLLHERVSDLSITKRLRMRKNAVLIVHNADGTETTLDLTELAALDTLTAAEVSFLSTLVGLGATEAEIDRVADVSDRLVALDATTLAVTEAAHENRIVRMDHTAAASTATLPAATGSGAKYTFLVGAVNVNNHIINVPDASHTFEGIAFMANDTDNSVSAFESGASDDTITLNGTTTGGAAIGDKVEIIDLATNQFQVIAHLTGTGAEATPFSAAV